MTSSKKWLWHATLNPLFNGIEGNLEFGWGVPLNPYFCSIIPLELEEISVLQNTILCLPWLTFETPSSFFGLFVFLAAKMDGFLLVAYWSWGRCSSEVSVVGCFWLPHGRVDISIFAYSFIMFKRLMWKETVSYIDI